MRRGLEFIVLLKVNVNFVIFKMLIFCMKGIGAMMALIYAHVGYPLSATCLEPLKVRSFISGITMNLIGRSSKFRVGLLSTSFLNMFY